MSRWFQTSHTNSVIRNASPRVDHPDPAPPGCQIPTGLSPRTYPSPAPDRRPPRLSTHRCDPEAACCHPPPPALPVSVLSLPCSQPRVRTFVRANGARVPRLLRHESRSDPYLTGTPGTCGTREGGDATWKLPQGGRETLRQADGSRGKVELKGGAQIRTRADSKVQPRVVYPRAETLHGYHPGFGAGR